jgi:hypothetical protein
MSETTAPNVAVESAGAPLDQWNATLQLVRSGIDTVEEIAYQRGRFVRRSRVVPRDFGPWTELDRQAIEQLRIELEREVKSENPGVDVPALRVFIDLLGEAIERNA